MLADIHVPSQGKYAAVATVGEVIVAYVAWVVKADARHTENLR